MGTAYRLPPENIIHTLAYYVKCVYNEGVVRLNPDAKETAMATHTVQEHDERKTGGFLYVYVIAPDPTAIGIGPLVRPCTVYKGRTEVGVRRARAAARRACDRLNGSPMGV